MRNLTAVAALLGGTLASLQKNAEGAPPPSAEPTPGGTPADPAPTAKDDGALVAAVVDGVQKMTDLMRQVEASGGAVSDAVKAELSGVCQGLAAALGGGGGGSGAPAAPGPATKALVHKAVTLDDKTAAGLMLSGSGDSIWAAQRALSEGDMAKASSAIQEAVAKLNAITTGLGGGGAPPADTSKAAAPPPPPPGAKDKPKDEEPATKSVTLTPGEFLTWASSQAKSAETEEPEVAQKRLQHLANVVALFKADHFSGSPTGLSSGWTVTMETVYAPMGGKVSPDTDRPADQSVEEAMPGPSAGAMANGFAERVVKGVEDMLATLALGGITPAGPAAAAVPGGPEVFPLDAAAVPSVWASGVSKRAAVTKGDRTLSGRAAASALGGWGADPPGLRDR